MTDLTTVLTAGKAKYAQPLATAFSTALKACEAAYGKAAITRDDILAIWRPLYDAHTTADELLAEANGLIGGKGGGAQTNEGPDDKPPPPNG